MRKAPFVIAGGVMAAIIGGAFAGTMIETTPRQIHDSVLPKRTASSTSAESAPRSSISRPDQFDLRTNGETVSVGELRERGLYSQDRYGRSVPELYGDAADAIDDVEFEEEATSRSGRRAERDASGQSTQRERANTEPAIRYVSRPVVQQTNGNR